MRKRSRIALGLACAVVLVAALAAYAWRTLDTAGEPEPVRLFLSTEPSGGSYGDPEGGLRSEEAERQTGRELIALPESGPVRCRLRVTPDEADEPDLAVDLTNASDTRVTLQGHSVELDFVTFILRDPDSEVVSTFNYARYHSIRRNPPPFVIEAGGTKTMTVSLGAATSHGFQRLAPGRYTVEAVFRDSVSFGAPVVAPQMLARSNRLPIEVAKPRVRVGDVADRLRQWVRVRVGV